MKNNICFTLSAREDLFSLYEQSTLRVRGKNTAERQFSELKFAILNLSFNPFKAPVVLEHELKGFEYRRLDVAGFSAIYYDDSATSTVYILRIFSAQHPFLALIK